MIASPGKYASPPLAAALVSAGVFVVYLLTLAPGVTFIDSGELAAVACTLGIAHPTGYPLFTLVGWIFSHLPIPGEEIFRLNVMAALFSSGGVFMMILLLSHLLGEGEREAGVRKIRHALIPAVASALMLGFSPVYWMQATAAEVYSIHLFFIPTLLFLFLKAWRGGIGEVRSVRSWILFALVLGLAFTNHMTTVLLSIGLLYLFFLPRTSGSAVPSFRDWRESIALIGWMIPPFLLGLSLYLYLPLRASQDPLFSWGDPVTPERFLRHIGGKQYSVWIFASAETAWRQFLYFLRELGGQTAWVGLGFALIGVRVMWRKQRRYAWATVLFFVTCVGYAINYDIHDIDSYFLLAYFVLAIWGAYGIRTILKWGERKSGRAGVPSVPLLVCALLPLFLNFSSRDESANHLVEDYTHNMFSSFGPNALVMSFQWDFWVSASYYYQAVDSLRPDVVVIDKELLRRSWYLKELERRYPWLIERSRKEVDLFARELEKFERDLPYDPALIQARFVGLIRSFFLNNSERPLYVTAEIEPEFTSGFERFPEGLAFRLRRPGESHSPVMPEIRYRPFHREGRLETR
ncbi:MAG: DUF2723 domain-containing protein, partial [Ignavibacteria bacterium]|nr:DUF2723 domain-containing protein [Ignavibacteria bacterium]